MAVSDWSTTAASNLSVGGVSIAEGWSAASVNNAIRGLMAEIAGTGILAMPQSVKSHGAVGDGVTNDTAAIQAALDTGDPIVFPEGTYLCANLTMSTVAQCLYGVGSVILKKNANGPILTCSGANQQLRDLKFYGDASSPTYTGDNVVSSGNHFSMLNCGSRWAYARAVLATGNHVQILGTNDIYQTAATGGTDHDIEIGVSGTATLYHQLYGIYSSQASGGIKLTDTGSAVIFGGQFGKLTIAAGTLPSGVNGGNIIGTRILGDITVDISNAVFAANTFSNITLTLGAATSGCRIDSSNTYASGFSIVNSGNTDNLYETSHGSGASAGVQYSAGNYLDNGKYTRYAGAAGDWTTYGSISMSSTTLVIQNTAGSNQYYVPSAGSHQFYVNSVEFARIDADGLVLKTAAGDPGASNVSLGNTTQTTVGAAGGASALPATPLGYLKAYVGTTLVAIPYYTAA